MHLLSAASHKPSAQQADLLSTAGLCCVSFSNASAAETDTDSTSSESSAAIAVRAPPSASSWSMQGGDGSQQELSHVEGF